MADAGPGFYMLQTCVTDVYFLTNTCPANHTCGEHIYLSSIYILSDSKSLVAQWALLPGPV